MKVALTTSRPRQRGFHTKQQLWLFYAFSREANLLSCVVAATSWCLHHHHMFIGVFISVYMWWDFSSSFSATSSLYLKILKHTTIQIVGHRPTQCDMKAHVIGYTKSLSIVSFSNDIEGFSSLEPRWAQLRLLLLSPSDIFLKKVMMSSPSTVSFAARQDFGERGCHIGNNRLGAPCSLHSVP